MATVKQGTLVAPEEWADHLRPQGKRWQARLERMAARQEIARELHELTRPGRPRRKTYVSE